MGAVNVRGLGLFYRVTWHYSKTASLKEVPYCSRCSIVNDIIISPNTVYPISSVLDILRTYRSLWRAYYEKGERITSESEVILLTPHWFADLVIYAGLLSFPSNLARRRQILSTWSEYKLSSGKCAVGLFLFSKKFQHLKIREYKCYGEIFKLMINYSVATN
jgi:hypothetical protein